MRVSKNISLLGFASGVAAGDLGCADGPVVLMKSKFKDELAKAGLSVKWLETFYPQSKGTALEIVSDLCTRLAVHAQKLSHDQKPFVVLGGDHSSAIGTWSGVYAAQSKKGAMGMVWIDAHMDSHTPETSPSGNIHGMPVAALLGYGAKELTQILSSDPKFLPQHMSLIGIRSFEEGEAELINRLGVRVYSMTEIKQRGISEILQEAIQRAKNGTVGYGMSIDLDALDPKDAPAVGTPEPFGINANELCEALIVAHNDSKLLGVEITEFNPHHDDKRKTEKLIERMLLGIFLGEKKR